MLNVLKEFARGSLAIRVVYRLSSNYAIDVLADLFILCGISVWISSDNGPELVAGTMRQCGRPYHLH